MRDFALDGDPVFPGPPTDGLYPSMEIPVTEDTIPSFFQSPGEQRVGSSHLVPDTTRPLALGKWGSLAIAQLCTGAALTCLSPAAGATPGLCPVLIRPMSLQAVGHPSPAQSSFPVPRVLTQVRLLTPPGSPQQPLPPVQPLSHAGSSLSPALPLLSPSQCWEQRLRPGSGFLLRAVRLEHSEPHFPHL